MTPPLGDVWREDLPSLDKTRRGAPPAPQPEGQFDRMAAELRDRPRLRRWIAVAFGLAAAALVVLSGASAWWSAPRPATVADLRADLAAGDVTSAQRVSGFDRSSPRSSAPPTPEVAEGPAGALLAWTTSSGRVKYVAADEQVTPEDPYTLTVNFEPRPRTEALEAELDAAGVPRLLVSTPLQRFLPEGTTTTILLVAAMRASAPRRGTRWFWAFLTFTTPWGVGLLAWLAVERPWRLDVRTDGGTQPGVALTDAASDAASDAAPVAPRRWNGLAGWAAGIVVSFTLMGVAAAARALVGTGLAPH